MRRTCGAPAWLRLDRYPDSASSGLARWAPGNHSLSRERFAVDYAVDGDELHCRMEHWADRRNNVGQAKILYMVIFHEYMHTCRIDEFGLYTGVLPNGHTTAGKEFRVKENNVHIPLVVQKYDCTSNLIKCEPHWPVNTKLRLLQHFDLEVLILAS